MEQNYLAHHGVKGQKWGVRRYQRKDGSLTAAGRAKRRSGDGVASRAVNSIKSKIAARQKKAAEARKAKADEKAAAEKKQAEEKAKQASRKKSVKDMTDEELANAIVRAQLEQRYKDLVPEQVSAGKQFISTIGKDMILPAVVSSGKKFLSDALDKAGANLLKDQVAQDELTKLKKEFDILNMKKQINDLKNPKETIDAYLKRMKNEKDLKDYESGLFDIEREAKIWENKKKAASNEKEYNEKYGSKPDNNSGNSSSTSDSKTSNKSSTKSDKSTTTKPNKTEKEVYDGPIEIIGEGTSKRSQQNTSSKKKTTASDIIDGSGLWRDVTVSETSSSSYQSVGSSYVSGLLSGSSGTALLNRPISGLLSGKTE